MFVVIPSTFYLLPSTSSSVVVVPSGVDLAFSVGEPDFDRVLAAGAVRLLEDEDVAAGDRAAHAVHGETREDVGLLVGTAGQFRDGLEVRFERVVIGVCDVEGEDV